MVALRIAVTTQENLVIFTLSRVSVELTNLFKLPQLWSLGAWTTEYNIGPMYARNDTSDDMEANYFVSAFVSKSFIILNLNTNLFTKLLGEPYSPECCRISSKIRKYSF